MIKQSIPAPPDFFSLRRLGSTPEKQVAIAFSALREVLVAFVVDEAATRGRDLPFVDELRRKETVLTGRDLFPVVISRYCDKTSLSIVREQKLN